MQNTFRPATGKTRTTTATSTPRAENGAGNCYAPTYPTLATARQVAALAARLPKSDPSAVSRIRHIEALAIALNWSDDSRAAQIWRLVDWQAVRLSFGNAKGMTATQIERMRPDELAELLAELVAIQDDTAAGSGRKPGAAKSA
jgi:hypothetical protein